MEERRYPWFLPPFPDFFLLHSFPPSHILCHVNKRLFHPLPQKSNLNSWDVDKNCVKKENYQLFFEKEVETCARMKLKTQLIGRYKNTHFQHGKLWIYFE